MSSPSGQWWSPRSSIFDEIEMERGQQIAKFGDQSHLPDGTGGPQFRARANAAWARGDARGES